MTAVTAAQASRPIHHHLYVQVLCAIALGVLIGYFFPAPGASLKPLGDGFIGCIKMVIAPIIFCTVVHGIASMEDMKKVGRVGLKALIYFEVVTTLALVDRPDRRQLWQPGAGMNVDVGAHRHQGDRRPTRRRRTSRARSTIVAAHHPDTVVGAFAEGDVLQVLFFALLFAFALHFMGERGKPLLRNSSTGVRTRSSASSRIDHAGGAARRVRRHGLHRRPLRPRHAGLARPADGELLRHLPAVHLRRARGCRAAVRVSTSSSSSATSRRSC